MLYNLREYHRPTDLGEAIRLLRREDIHTVAIGGGVSVVGEGTPEIEAVVDLDGLGLDFLEHEGSILRIGTMVRIQTLVETLDSVASGSLAETARRMAGWHVRNASTLGGALASGNIHAPLCVMLAALDATVTLYDGKTEQTSTWQVLAERVRQSGLHGELIIAITFDAPPGIGAAYEQVARTPADQPIVSAAAVARPGSRGQVVVTTVVGGLLHGLATAKGEISEGRLDDVVAQLADFGEDEAAYQSDYRGSASYRRAAAMILARRTMGRAVKEVDLAK